MSNPAIKLGQGVRCVVSGFSGTAIQFLEQLNGNVQVAIQPRQKEGDLTLPDAMFIDPHMLEIIDKVGVVSRVTTPVKNKIKLGNVVRDKASNLEGVAIEKATYMNGCVSFGVMPKRRETDLINANPDKTWISVERLEVVGEGILVDEVKPAKPPGGPSSRVTNRY